MPIDLSDVVTDADLAIPFTIQRSTGSFQLGGWVQSSINVPGYGVLTDASAEDLEMIPEADRLTGSRVIYSATEIYVTEQEGGAGQQTFGGSQSFVGGTQRVSDQIYWNGQLYRILHVTPMPDFGYWKAIGVRMSGR